MENLPPPPPHLLQYSGDEAEDAADGGSRPLSVAESVRVLQAKGHTPCSPRTLRRAHSAAPTAGASPAPPPTTTGIKGIGSFGKPAQQMHQSQEQIYAPVAHLQQKLQQRQLQHMQQQQQVQPATSPEGEHYGFGVQFQQHASQFYQMDGGQQQQQQFQQMATVQMQQQHAMLAASHDQVREHLQKLSHHLSIALADNEPSGP